MKKRGEEVKGGNYGGGRRKRSGMKKRGEEVNGGNRRG